MSLAQIRNHDFEYNTNYTKQTVPKIRIGDYRFVFIPQKRPSASRYLGSAWRGALGYALKRTVCVTRQPVCEQCILYRSCTYAKIFETPPPLGTEKMRKYNSVPHPFLLLPEAIMKNSEYLLQLRLFGNGNQDLAYLVHALQMAGRSGVAHTRFELVRIEQFSDSQSQEPLAIYINSGKLAPLPPFNADIPKIPEKINIHFATPFRLKRNGKLVTPDSFTFHALFSALLRRQSMLSYFHEDESLNVPFRTLSDLAHQVVIENKTLKWIDWTRKSSRQETTMQMGGVMGSITLDTNKLQPFWPYLWLGQWTHAGKATVMGLGNYKILVSE